MEPGKVWVQSAALDGARRPAGGVAGGREHRHRRRRGERPPVIQRGRMGRGGRPARAGRRAAAPARDGGSFDGDRPVLRPAVGPAFPGGASAGGGFQVLIYGSLVTFLRRAKVSYQTSAALRG